MKLNERKCDKCGKWSDGEKYFCNHCGVLMDEERLEEEKKRHESQEGLAVALIKIYPTDHIIVKGIKHIIRIGQIIYFAILTFILWVVAFMSG